MAFYEFACPNCKVVFGLSLETDGDPTNLFCVECGSIDLQLTAYDEELSLRIASLVDSVNDLTERVKNIEEEVDAFGSDDIKVKKQDPVN
jgi:hypothetical protein